MLIDRPSYPDKNAPQEIILSDQYDLEDELQKQNREPLHNLIDINIDYLAINLKANISFYISAALQK
jgi:hypothetical protein